ncbi:MAG: hypothetical protein AB8B83_07625 [Bdellovibrionales bacterium]
MFWALDNVFQGDEGAQNAIGVNFDEAMRWFDARIISDIGFDPSDEDERQDFIDAVLAEAKGDDEALEFIGNDVHKALAWYRDYSLYTLGYSPDLDLGYDENRPVIDGVMC